MDSFRGEKEEGLETVVHEEVPSVCSLSVSGEQCGRGRWPRKAGPVREGSRAPP